MPKRTNSFQEVVAIIHRHLSDGGEVEESAFLVDRTTKRKREVDVTIRGSIAGYPVIVSVEASATERRASVEWVERMVGKHANLDTTTLVLVSEAGFTEQATERAEADAVITLQPEDVTG